MAKQVRWTKQLTEQFIELAMLSDEEAYVIRSRVKGCTVTEQAMHLNKSVPTVHRMISKLKKKYDTVQAEHPDVFPIRYVSAKETWLDTH